MGSPWTDKFYYFKKEFKTLFEKGFDFSEDGSKYHFHISGKLINVFEKEFTAQFVITNLSESPFSIENFNLYFDYEKPLQRLKSDININSFSIIYLRCNEAHLFTEKFSKNEIKHRIDKIMIEIKISGHRTIQHKRDLSNINIEKENR